MKNKVISLRNFPSRIPLTSTVVWALLLDRLDAPQWLWGAWCLLAAAIMITAIVGLCTQEKVDIFKGKP